MDTVVDKQIQRRIVFVLADEYFGVEIEKVKEIIRPIHITRVPKSSNAVEGVINLRGKVVPVINLAKRFGIAHEEDPHRRFLVVEHNRALVGLIVDGVDEVVEFTEEEVLPPPLISQTFNREFLEGIIKRDDKIVVLVSIDKLLNKEIERIKAHEC